MVRRPFSGPRPLPSVDCLLAIVDYTAVPSLPISENTTRWSTDDFRQAATDHLPVETVSTASHPQYSDLLGGVPRADLETDRLGLQRYLAFLDTYAQLLGVDTRAILNTGIDGRLTRTTSIPQLRANNAVVVFVVVEIQFPTIFTRTDRERVLADLDRDLSWVADTAIRGAQTGLLQSQDGPNTLVVRQVLDLVDELKQHGIGGDRVTFSCSVVEQ